MILWAKGSEVGCGNVRLFTCWHLWVGYVALFFLVHGLKIPVTGEGRSVAGWPVSPSICARPLCFPSRSSVESSSVISEPWVLPVCRQSGCVYAISQTRTLPGYLLTMQGPRLTVSEDKDLGRDFPVPSENLTHQRLPLPLSPQRPRPPSMDSVEMQHEWQGQSHNFIFKWLTSAKGF